jgi:HEAT repeats
VVWRSELMSSDPAQQDKGFSEIAKLGPKDAFDALRAVIANGDGLARLRALQFMEQDSAIDETRVLSALRQALSDQDPTLRDYAMQALGRQGSAEALTALQQQFEAGDAAIRLSVLEAVSQRADAGALIQQAANDPDQRVRTLAAQLLQGNGVQVSGQHGQPEAQTPAAVQMEPTQDNPDPGAQPDSGDDQPDPQ